MKLGAAPSVLALAVTIGLVAAHYVQTRRTDISVLPEGWCLVRDQLLRCGDAVGYVSARLRTPKFVGVSVSADPTNASAASALVGEFRRAGFRVRTGVLKVGTIPVAPTRGSDV
jgi:hypothetical protein